MHLDEIFQNLVELIKSAGIHLYFDGRLGNETPLDGWYAPDPWKNALGPQIHILRNHAQKQEDPTQELLTLAHEFGHHQSFLDHNRTSEYEELVDKSAEWKYLKPEQKQIILNEEIRAWKYAKNTLQKLGFSDWEQFKKRKTDSLYRYQKLLNIRNKKV